MPHTHEIVHAAGGPHGGKMQEVMEKKEIERAAPRNATEAAITCRPFASNGDVCALDGVMRDFSSQGSYIEMSQKFEPGAILIMRTVRYPQCRHLSLTKSGRDPSAWPTSNGNRNWLTQTPFVLVWGYAILINQRIFSTL